MELSILIPTVVERKYRFYPLYANLLQQAKDKPVEVLYLSDNKELPIGTKRQQLLEMAQGRFIVFFDDDDTPANNYVDLILQAITEPLVDCVGIRVKMTTNGNNPQICLHRFKHPMAEGMAAAKYGVDYVRPITHFNPVLRVKALQAGFGNERFGEDAAYWSRVNPLLSCEYYIPEILFDYNYSNLQPHNQKYGIK